MNKYYTQYVNYMKIIFIDKYKHSVHPLGSISHLILF